MNIPSQYVYTLPEDYIMKPEHRKRLDDLVDSLQLTNLEAQSLLDLHVTLTDEYAEALGKALRPLFAVVFILGTILGVVLASLVLVLA